MTETPETDAFDSKWDSCSHPFEAIDLARKLERERDEAREQERIHYDNYIAMKKERDEVREQVKELIYIAENERIDLADIDFENDKFGVVSELRDD